jgi:hypothetical protein
MNASVSASNRDSRGHGAVGGQPLPPPLQQSGHVSVCAAHLARLQLIEAQLDTTEAALNAAQSKFDRAKR